MHAESVDGASNVGFCHTARGTTQGATAASPAMVNGSGVGAGAGGLAVVTTSLSINAHMSKCTCNSRARRSVLHAGDGAQASGICPASHPAQRVRAAGHGEAAPQGKPAAPLPAHARVWYRERFQEAHGQRSLP